MTYGLCLDAKNQIRRPDCRSRGRPAAIARSRFTCRNCGAHFVARYGTQEDADTETVDVQKCGLCGGDSFRKDVFKDTTIRLIAQVTARNVKRH